MNFQAAQDIDYHWNGAGLSAIESVESLPPIGYLILSSKNK